MGGPVERVTTFKLLGVRVVAVGTACRRNIVESLIVPVFLEAA